MQSNGWMNPQQPVEEWQSYSGIKGYVCDNFTAWMQTEWSIKCAWLWLSGQEVVILQPVRFKDIYDAFYRECRMSSFPLHSQIIAPMLSRAWIPNEKQSKLLKRFSGALIAAELKRFENQSKRMGNHRNCKRQWFLQKSKTTEAI